MGMLIVDALLDASHHDAAQPTDVEHEIATYLDLPPIPPHVVSSGVHAMHGGERMRAASQR